MLAVDDRRAVDAVLNHAASVQPAVVDEVAMPEKVLAVTKLLSLLDRLPASDPPADLMDRTLRRIAGLEQDQIRHTRAAHSIMQTTHLH